MDHVMLGDGRRLDVRVTGPANGQVLVAHVGTPMAATRLRFLEGPAHERGLRVVTMSRPGYGDSTRRAGRTVVDAVADTREVLEELGVTSCLVLGYSGGGPHALACAARLGGVRAVLVIAGTAPYMGDPVWMDGMGEENVKGFTAAVEGEEALRPLLEEDPDRMQSVTVEQMVENLASLLPDVDRALMTDEFGDDILASMQEGYRVGVDGSLDDSLALVQPWGFELDEIDVPTILWQGSLDKMVPFSHGRQLADRLTGAASHLESGEGHVSIVVGAMGTMLDELIAAGGEPPAE
ncbi:alpha/beta fold hydrolase [Zhihengliuella salsuginis]|nr:alpha/beta hydrolase [Zhihengliuella salsuginis]